MRILVLGGTAWLGGEVARQAVAAGDQVVCLARGSSGDVPPGARLVRADRSQASAYDEVRDRDWDAVVDVSWQPGMVRSALKALGPRARHWTYVSSCSAYADQSVPDTAEDAALLPALQGDEAAREEYGEAKVACELACQGAVGDRLLVARAGLIGGYGDRSDRFGYWPGRFARGGEVLVPDARELAAQTIDVEDLAAWLLRCAREAVTGTFNAVGEVRTLGEVLDAARVAAGHDGEVVPVGSQWLAEQGVEEYMGPESVPLWIVAPDFAGFSRRDGSAAVAAGLRHRPLTSLVERALAWERELGLDRERRAGLSPAREAELIAAWRARSA